MANALIGTEDRRTVPERSIVRDALRKVVPTFDCADAEDCAGRVGSVPYSAGAATVVVRLVARKRV